MILSHIVIQSVEVKTCCHRKIITKRRPLNPSRNDLTSGGSSTASSTPHSQYHQQQFIQRERFWHKNWNLHRREPFEFVGIPLKSKQHVINMLMKLLVDFEDHFFHLLSGQMPTPKSMHTTWFRLTPPIKIKKVMHIFWDNFFRSSALKEISYHPRLLFDKWTVEIKNVSFIPKLILNNFRSNVSNL